MMWGGLVTCGGLATRLPRRLKKYQWDNGSGRMSNLQSYLAIGLPVLFQSNIHRLLDAFRSEVDARIDGVVARIDGLQRQMDARFDAQTQALLRVERVMDARLRLLEQR